MTINLLSNNASDQSNYIRMRVCVCVLFCFNMAGALFGVYKAYVYK